MSDIVTERSGALAYDIADYSLLAPSKSLQPDCPLAIPGNPGGFEGRRSYRPIFRTVSKRSSGVLWFTSHSVGISSLSPISRVFGVLHGVTGLQP